MSWQSALVLGSALAVPLLVMFLILVYIPNIAHSAYRDRLWQIRDSLVCDLLSGRIGHTKPAEQLLRFLDTSIRQIPKHTLTDVLTAFWVLRSEPPPRPLEDVLLDGSAQGDRLRLMGYLREYKQASIRHLARSSVSGWLLWLMARPVRLASTRKRPDKQRRRDSLGERAVRTEAAAMPKLMAHRVPDGAARASWL